MLAEHDHAQQGGGDRVKDGEAGLGRGQRPGRHRVRGQQHRGRAGDHQRVDRPVAEDRGRAAGHPRAELLDDGGDETPGDAGRDAEPGGPAGGRRRLTGGLRLTGETAGQGDREGHRRQRYHRGEPPPAGRPVRPAAGRRGRAQEHADAGRHRDDGQPVAPVRSHPTVAGQQRQPAEHEQQLEREDRLHQRQRPEVQGGDLEHEAADHAGETDQPGRLPGQPEDEPGIEAALLGARLLQIGRAETLADGAGGGAYRGSLPSDSTIASSIKGLLGGGAPAVHRGRYGGPARWCQPSQSSRPGRRGGHRVRGDLTGVSPPGAPGGHRGGRAAGRSRPRGPRTAAPPSPAAAPPRSPAGPGRPGRCQSGPARRGGRRTRAGS